MSSEFWWSWNTASNSFVVVGGVLSFAAAVLFVISPPAAPLASSLGIAGAAFSLVGAGGLLIQHLSTYEATREKHLLSTTPGYTQILRKCLYNISQECGKPREEDVLDIWFRCAGRKDLHVYTLLCDNLIPNFVVSRDQCCVKFTKVKESTALYTQILRKCIYKLREECESPHDENVVKIWFKCSDNKSGKIFSLHCGKSVPPGYVLPSDKCCFKFTKLRGKESTLFDTVNPSLSPTCAPLSALCAKHEGQLDQQTFHCSPQEDRSIILPYEASRICGVHDYDYLGECCDSLFNPQPPIGSTPSPSNVTTPRNCGLLNTICLNLQERMENTSNTPIFCSSYKRPDVEYAYVASRLCTDNRYRFFGVCCIYAQMVPRTSTVSPLPSAICGNIDLVCERLGGLTENVAIYCVGNAPSAPARLCSSNRPRGRFQNCCARPVPTTVGTTAVSRASVPSCGTVSAMCKQLEGYGKRLLYCPDKKRPDLTHVYLVSQICVSEKDKDYSYLETCCDYNMDSQGARAIHGNPEQSTSQPPQKESEVTRESALKVLFFTSASISLILFMLVFGLQIAVFVMNKKKNLSMLQLFFKLWFVLLAIHLVAVVMRIIRYCSPPKYLNYEFLLVSDINMTAVLISNIIVTTFMIRALKNKPISFKWQITKCCRRSESTQKEEDKSTEDTKGAEEKKATED